MENQAIENVKLLIIVGVLITLLLAIAIAWFVVFYQRKMLLKEARILEMEKEKQIELFRATVEAEEKQKEKIARNLHDEINPVLNIIKLNISMHRKELVRQQLLPDTFDKDEELLDKAIEGIRASCLELVPSFLVHFGLAHSMEDHINNLKNAHPISFMFSSLSDSDWENHFDTNQQLTVYRLFLEVINNILKHGKCTLLGITVIAFENYLSVEFLHNGVVVTNEQIEGFTAKSTGLGLKSIQARVILLKAKLDYTQEEGNALIKLLIPFE